MERKCYHIPTLPAGTTVATVDWNVVPAAQIDTYRWLDGGYEPHAEARLAFLPGYGFALRMSCVERSPRAVYSGYNEPVYTDSCLEFFAAWAEGSPTRDRRYMNMEMNARGTLLSCLGTDRHARVPVRDITGGSIPDVRGEILPDRWFVTAGIPATLLGKVYGSDPAVFMPGYSFRGNFYKCGDETAVPHYGMWNPVCTDKPDFHRPEYFGDFVIDCP